ncbi:MAG: GNAT family N-acetyltransferase [Methylobacter sp.]|nr:GNAT family N-acetyltransferase [Methylobacter sp.]
MIGIATADHVLIGIPALQTRAADFERIFSSIAAPATGRWLGLMIWMEKYSKYEPWGVLVERNGAVVAAAILTRYRRFGLWCIGKPGGLYDPVRFGALDDDAAARLAQAICDSANGFGGPWRLQVSDLPCPDTVVNHLRSVWQNSQIQLTSPLPCLYFAPGASLNTYLSRNTRAAVAKARNRIKREGIQMIQEWTRDPQRILKLLPQIEDIYHCRDLQVREKSLIDDPIAKSFFETFVAEYARQGLINLLILQLDGDLAAFALCLLDNGEYWVLVNRASPAWLRYSPGTIANAEVIRHAFDDADSIGVNWGGKPERYKLSGEVTLVPRQTLYAWSSDTVRLLLRTKQTLAQNVANIRENLSVRLVKPMVQ